MGEIVLDIIFRDTIPVAARPGGSMLNSAVSLGRAGAQVQFIGKTGTDRASDMIVDFLAENHVGTCSINRNPEEKATIALAFLNASGDATYSFYSSPSDQPLEFGKDAPGENDIVLFGSFYSLSAAVRKTLVPFLRKAKENGALIVYDPNFRKPHLPQLKEVLPSIRENISLSDIIRGSDEDFLHIFAAGDAEQALNMSEESPHRTLVFTKNSRDVEILKQGMRMEVSVPQIDPVSTIGAGDAFNAGMILALLQKGIRTDNMDTMGKEVWKEIAGTGIRFSADVCLSLDNYISETFVTGLR
ncbi:MAG: PfkB family carbohydrate kinase [Bacteroidetes bacterium]|nr:PfkB family carbohydrate kinase [Bacteroidota bacterium]